jgi:hypothetical protein
VVTTKAERHARGFTCWGQFVRCSGQLGRALAGEICGGLAVVGGYASGHRRGRAGATLAHKCASAVATVEQVFYQLLAQCQQIGGAKKFRFKNKLLSLDATIIDLCAETFEWAAFRRTKGAVKLHFTLDHDGYLPTVLVITEGKRHELKVARTQTFAAGTSAPDRHIDYAWLARLDAAGVLRDPREAQSDYQVVERRAVPLARDRDRRVDCLARCEVRGNTWSAGRCDGLSAGAGDRRDAKF